jgi:hypothetical protein
VLTHSADASAPDSGPDVATAGPRRVLPYNPKDYRARAYPGDRGPTQFVDDGNTFALRMPPRSPWPVVIVAVFPFLCFFVVSGAAFDVYYTGRTENKLWLVAGAISAVVSGGATLLQQIRPRVSWIEVDRRARVVRLPRERLDLAFDRIVRLQALRIWEVVTPFSYRHGCAELQLVWLDNGRELTSCLVTDTGSRAVKRFAARFEAATGVAVNLVEQKLGSEFHVSPFNPAGGKGAPAGARA